MVEVNIMVDEKEKQDIKVVKKTDMTTEQKETKTISVDTILKELSTIDGINTKESKSGWITIKADKNICYIKNAKYGISMWSIKQGKTIRVETPTDVKEFTDAIKKSIKTE